MTELPCFLLGPVGGQRVARVGEAMACPHHWALRPSSSRSPLPSSGSMDSQSPHLKQEGQQRRRGEAVRVPHPPTWTRQESSDGLRVEAGRDSAAGLGCWACVFLLSCLTTLISVML